MRYVKSNQLFRKMYELGHRWYSTSSQLVHTSKYKSWRDIPGPSKFEIIRQRFNLTSKQDRIHEMDAFDAQQYLFKKYGPISKIDGVFGAPSMIQLCDPESFAQIHRGESWCPERPTLPLFEYFAKEYNKSSDEIAKNEPTGLFTDHGENWRKLRLILNPVLLKPEVIKLYHDDINDIAMGFVHRIKNLRDENNMIKNKLDIEFNNWSLKSVAVVALGRKIEEKSLHLVNCVQNLFKHSEEMNFRSNALWRYFHSKRVEKAMRNFQEMMDLCEYYIKEAKKDYKKELKPKINQSVLEKLLEVDERIATILVSDILFAAVHTTAHTTLLALYNLASNPEKQTKLREEILSGTNNKKYMTACIKESFRLFPVIPGNVRKTTKEHHVLGYKIPSNMLVGFSHYCCSVDENQYPQAKSFIPERWLVDESHPLHYGKAHPFSMSPFGFGSRACMGMRLAELEIQCLLNNFIKNFQVDWVGPPAKIKTTSINFMVEPFSFVFKDL